MTLAAIQQHASNVWATAWDLGSRAVSSAGYYKDQFLANETVKKAMALGKTHIVDNVVKHSESVKYEWTTRNASITCSVISVVAFALLGYWLGPAGARG